MKKQFIVWMLGITVGGAALAQQTSTLIRSSSSKAATATASAAEVDTTVYPYTPFMFSIVTPLQVPSSNFDVGGLRINAIYGECQNFDGFVNSGFATVSVSPCITSSNMTAHEQHESNVPITATTAPHDRRRENEKRLDDFIT